MSSLAAAVHAEPCSPAVPQLTSGLKSSWRLLAVNEVLEPDGASAVNADHMAELLRSFEMLGGQLQLQPIVVDEHLVLVDGRHRLEAAKRAGWSRIAALVICGATVEMRPLLAAEANRVRRTLNVLELESIWRAHYEPDLRAAAKERQLAGLRMRDARDAESGPALSSADRLVIGNSNNQSVAGEGVRIATNDSSTAERGGTRHESVGRAAKRITGHSLDTLNKVARIRELATSEAGSPELREAAKQGLQRLATPGASVEMVYRALRERAAEAALGFRSVGVQPQKLKELEKPDARLDARGVGGARLAAVTSLDVARDEQALERALAECSRLAERFEGALAGQLQAAAGRGDAERDMLRATRVSLAHCLATVVAIECELESQPMLALRSVGLEVSSMLSSISLQYLRAQRAAA